MALILRGLRMRHFKCYCLLMGLGCSANLVRVAGVTIGGDGLPPFGFRGGGIVDELEIFGGGFFEILHAALATQPYKAVGLTRFLVHILDDRSHVACFEFVARNNTGVERIGGDSGGCFSGKSARTGGEGGRQHESKSGKAGAEGEASFHGFVGMGYPLDASNRNRLWLMGESNDQTGGGRRLPAKLHRVR